MKIQLKRSNVIEGEGFAKKPTNTQMEYGELAVNYGAADPAIFMKDSNNNIIRISGREVPTDITPPENPIPGNFWYNPEDGRLYIYYKDADSAQWVDASPDDWKPQELPDITDPSQQPGTLDDRYVNLTGDTMTGNLLVGSEITLNESNGKITTAQTQDSDAGNTLVTKSYIDDNVLSDDFLSLRANAGDQVVLSTGDTSFTGRVGIGINDPSTKLEIRAESNTNTDYSLSLINSSKNYGMQIGAYGASNKSYGATTIDYKIEIGGDLILDTTGNVGIGTTNPADLLTVVGNSDPEIRVSAESTGASSAGLFIENQGQRNWQIWADRGTDALSFGRNARTITDVVIDRTGSVGIGTDNPQAKLHVLGGTSSTGSVETNKQLILSVTDNAAYQGSLSWGKKVGDSVYYALVLDAKTNNIPSDILLAPSGGNVGIGTDNPQAKLHVSGNNTTKLWLASSSNGRNSFDPDEASIDLTASGMNTTSKYTPSINFGSTDTDFTTTNPKFGAAINAEASQAYTSDTTGGMKLNFWTSPSNAGTGHALEQRMTITQFGNVGIGTDNPIENLSIGDTNGTASLSLISPTTASGDPYGKILFRHAISNGNRNAKIEALRAAGSSGADLAFYTRKNGDAVNNDGGLERMRIDTDGNVGIGTADPSTQLHIKASTPIFTIEDGGGADANTSRSCLLRDNNQYQHQLRNSTGAYTATSYAMVTNSVGTVSHSWKTGVNTNQLFVNGAGVGVGTADPESALHVKGTPSPILILENSGDSGGTRAAYIRFKFSDGYGGEILNLRKSGEDATDTYLSFRTGGLNAANEKMIILSNGNVGIGESNPQGCLDIGTSVVAGVPSIYLSRTPGVDNTSDIALTGNAVIRSENSIRNVINTGGYFSWNIGGTDVKAGTSGSSEMMRLNPSGNLGIGTSDPQAKLDVNGQIYAWSNTETIRFKSSRTGSSQIFTLWGSASSINDGNKVLTVTGNGDATFNGDVTAGNVTFNLAPEDTNNYTTTTETYTEEEEVTPYVPAVEAVYGEAPLITPAVDEVVGPLGNVLVEGTDAVYGEPPLISAAVDAVEATYQTVTKTRDVSTYTGPTLDVKDRLQKADAALLTLKTAAAAATDFASLKSAIITALADV